MSLRFSLLGLVAFITFAGLASAAMVRPGTEWLSVVVTLTISVIVLQVLRAALVHGEPRAAAVGWLLFACTYLTLAIGPWAAEHVGPQLLSSRGLAYAQTHWRKDPAEAYAIDSSGTYAQLVTFMLNSGNTANSAIWTSIYDYAGSGYPVVPIGGTVTMPMTPAICFRASGHWLCAWLCGWLGAVIAVQLHRRRAAATSSAESTKAA
jgi:hypothetical protein